MAVLLCDRSDWGVIEVADADRLAFLHNQSTNTFQQRRPGEGCDTVFVTATGRMIDLATVLIRPEACWLIVSPQRRTDLLTRLDKYIFFSDRVQLRDRTADLAVLSLVGAEADTLIEQLAAVSPSGWAAGEHHTIRLDGIEVELQRSSGLAEPGLTLVVPRDRQAAIAALLTEAGAMAADWSDLRLHQGRPSADAEITEDYNPLEAGLWDCIRFDKGCYIGQETIARLNTYQGVKQRLFGLRAEAPLTVGTTLTTPTGEKAGRITSVSGDGRFALAYIRTAASESGTTVLANGIPATTVELPYVHHEYWQPPAAQG